MASKKKKKQAKKLSKTLDGEIIIPKSKRRIKQKSNRLSSPATWLVALATLIITFASFFNSLSCDYVNWDDDKNFYENELVTTVNKVTFWKNTAKIFSPKEGHVIGNYNPLTIWSFALEQRLVKDEVKRIRLRHWTNVVLHLLCVLCVFWIGLRLGLNVFWAGMLALLFGVHPLRVESVTWVTERKDVLFGFFYLAAFHAYLKGKQEGFSIGRHVWIGLLFLLSLFSKVQAVLLPVSLVLLDYYLSDEGKITLKSILSKWYLFVASLVMGLINIYTLGLQGSTEEQAYSGISRLFIGSYSLVVYYVKALIPYQMSPLYPYPSPPLEWPFYVSILSFILTAGVLYWAYAKKKKLIFFGVGFFLVNVFLLLQILGAGQGFLADRFTYIPYLGLFFIMTKGAQDLISSNAKLNIPLLSLAILITGAYAGMTIRQTKIWQNSGTLWTHVLKHYKQSTLPWGNRANYYRDTGHTTKALSDYGEVLRLDPTKPEPWNSRARLYFDLATKKGMRDSLPNALHNYNKAIELKPDDAEYWTNRGATFAMLGNGPAAIENLNEAERLNPSFANIYLNRSVIHNQDGRFPEALSDIDKYLALKQNHPDMWYEKGRLHNIMNQPTQAITALNNAIAMNGRKALFYFERAKAHYKSRNNPAAKQDLNTSLQMGYKGDPTTISAIQNSQ